MVERVHAPGKHVSGSGVGHDGCGTVAVAARFSFTATVVGFPILSLGLGLLVLSAASHRGWIGRFRVWGAETTALLAYSLYLTHKEVIHLDGMYLARFVDPGGVAR